MPFNVFRIMKKEDIETIKTNTNKTNKLTKYTMIKNRQTNSHETFIQHIKNNTLRERPK